MVSADWLRAAEIHVVSLPMRVAFRGITIREAALIRGPEGWGEFAPFTEYDDREAMAWLASAHEASHLTSPAPRRTTIRCNITVPAVAPDAAAALVTAASGDTVKVKVAERGQGLAADEARVAAVRRALDTTGRRPARIRIDANGAWSVAAATQAIRVLDAAAGGLEYAEQPCASVAELAALRRVIDVPVAADESIRRSDDPLKVMAAAAADLIVVKVAPLGGITRAIEVIGACGCPTVVSSAIDTSVGLAWGAALAAALDELPYACGLGTARLLAADVTGTPLVPDADGLLPVGRVEPDPALLGEYAAPPDRQRWWRERIARVAALDAERVSR